MLEAESSNSTQTFTERVRLKGDFWLRGEMGGGRNLQKWHVQVDKIQLSTYMYASQPSFISWNSRSIRKYLEICQSAKDQAK